MKFNRNIIFIMLAVVLGILASLSAVHYVHRVAEGAKAKASAKPKMERVAVPVHDLNKGDILAANDLAAREVPTEFVPAGAITPDDYENYVGGIVTMPLSHGVPVPALAVQSVANHFSSVIKPGDVAVTMQVDDVNSISGLIVPGDHVDMNLLLSGGKRGAQSRPLLSDVLVLATGQNTGGMRAGGAQPSGSGHQYSEVTLELSPLDAQRLNVASKVGSIAVWLRRAGSDAQLALGTLTKAELLGSGKHARRWSGIQFIIGGRG